VKLMRNGSIRRIVLLFFCELTRIRQIKRKKENKMGFERELLEEILQNEIELNEKYGKEKRLLLKGRLRVEKKGATNYYLHVSKADGQYIRKGITKDTDMIRALARKEFLNKMTGIFKHNIEALQKASDKIQDVDPKAIIESMTKAYKTLPPEYFFNAERFTIDHKLKGEEQLRMQRHIEWANAPFEQSTTFPERKNKITSFGLKVISKSEQLIAERLHDFGVPFRYECIIEIDTRRYAPDFTFQDAEMNLRYWEHAGFMNDYQYEQRHQAKLMDYRWAGIVPWDNLIVTYENEGQLNMAMVDAIIKNEIIPCL